MQVGGWKRTCKDWGLVPVRDGTGKNLDMNNLIKICGLTDPKNIRDLINLKPDFIGLIFHPKSPRYVSNPNSLVDVLKSRKNIKLVGVFVNEKKETVLELNKLLNFDYVQLHGSESPAYCADLKAHKLKVLMAFGISGKIDFQQTAPYTECADMFVFDTKTEHHGGSGRKFDWEVLNSYIGSTPFLLSGGIGPDDYPDIKNPAFAGLDLNSRFEVSPGLKDISLLSNYFNKMRNDQ